MCGKTRDTLMYILNNTTDICGLAIRTSLVLNAY